MLPKVSVWMITYNHEKYIEQAVESVMMQDYPNLELVIGEDYSTDRTREILLNLRDKYPDKIKLILHKENVGMIKNEIITRNECDGEYIAYLDGDDYWIDPQKISKQYDFLSKNSEYIMCFHQTKVINESTLSFPEYLLSSSNKRTEFSIEDIISGLFLQIGTMMSKNIPVDYIDWRENIKYGDRYIYLMLARHGKIKYFNECMAAYRVHPGGVWSTHHQNNRVENWLNKIYLFENFDKYTDYKYTEAIKKSIQAMKVEVFVEKIRLIEQYPEVEDEVNIVKLKILQKIGKRNICVFGAGTGGLRCKTFLNKLGIEPMYVIDNDSNKWGSFLDGIEIASPSIINKNEHFIIISSDFYKEINNQLISLKLEKHKDFNNMFEIL